MLVTPPLIAVIAVGIFTSAQRTSPEGELIEMTQHAPGDSVRLNNGVRIADGLIAQFFYDDFELAISSFIFPFNDPLEKIPEVIGKQTIADNFLEFGGSQMFG